MPQLCIGCHNFKWDATTLLAMPEPHPYIYTLLYLFPSYYFSVVAYHKLCKYQYHYIKIMQHHICRANIKVGCGLINQFPIILLFDVTGTQAVNK